MEGLDKDKHDRDAQLDQQNKASQGNKNSDARPHEHHDYAVQGTQKEVFDPVTQQNAVIENVNKEMMENVKDPTVWL